jgi:hypothetical protein
MRYRLSDAFALARWFPGSSVNRLTASNRVVDEAPALARTRLLAAKVDRREHVDIRLRKLPVLGELPQTCWNRQRRRRRLAEQVGNGDAQAVGQRLDRHGRGPCFNFILFNRPQIALRDSGLERERVQTQAELFAIAAHSSPERTARRTRQARDCSRTRRLHSTHRALRASSHESSPVLEQRAMRLAGWVRRCTTSTPRRERR